MPKRRLHPRLFAPAHTLVVWVLLVVGSSLLPDAARAEPLDGVTGTVNEATAPVTEAVEQVVPPVAAPSPTAQAPAAELPEVEVPNLPVEPAPVRLPKASAQPPSVPKVSETATKAVEAATDMATGTAGAVTSTGNGVVETTQGSAEEARETTLQTVESAAAGVERTANAPPTTASAGPAGPRETPDGSSAENAPPLRTAGGGATAAPSDFSSMVFPGFPARLLHPFIRVWPAVALLAESSLGSFVGRWSQSVLVLFEEEGVGSPRSGEEAATPADPRSGAAPSTEQPPFSWFGSPALVPFDWAAEENALIVVALFLVAGASTLAMLARGRRELGLPLLRRRSRFPWKH